MEWVSKTSAKLEKSYKETLEALGQGFFYVLLQGSLISWKLDYLLHLKYLGSKVSSARESNYAHQSDIVHTPSPEQQFVIDASNTPQQHQPNSFFLQSFLS